MELQAALPMIIIKMTTNRTGAVLIVDIKTCKHCGSDKITPLGGGIFLQIKFYWLFLSCCSWLKMLQRGRYKERSYGHSPEKVHLMSDILLFILSTIQKQQNLSMSVAVRMQGMWARQVCESHLLLRKILWPNNTCFSLQKTDLQP